MSIRIMQCLCPDRHCILAVAFDEQVTSTSEAERRLWEMIEDLVSSRILKRDCAICRRERPLHLETGTTKFKSLAEAEPILRQLARRQEMTREFLRAARN